jgi:RNA polymerase sigma factor (sigma-70 family)
VKAAAEPEFAWLFRSHFASIARTVNLIVFDRARAEDLTQDAFEALWRNWETLAGYERPDAWVRRVAVRLAVRAAHRERLRPALERIARRPAAEQTFPDIDLADALRTLAPMQRAAVVLYYLEDRPVAEIAHLLRVSDSTVKQHLHRARKRLAEILKEEVTEDVR